MDAQNILPIIARNLCAGDIFWASCCCKKWREVLSKRELWDKIKLRYLGDTAKSLEECRYQLKAAVWREYNLAYGISCKTVREMFPTRAKLSQSQIVTACYFFAKGPKNLCRGEVTYNTVGLVHTGGWQTWLLQPDRRVDKRINSGMFPATVVASARLQGSMRFIACNNRQICAVLHRYNFGTSGDWEKRGGYLSASDSRVTLPSQPTALSVAYCPDKAHLILYVGTEDGVVYRFVAPKKKCQELKYLDHHRVVDEEKRIVALSTSQSFTGEYHHVVAIGLEVDGNQPNLGVVHLPKVDNPRDQRLHAIKQFHKPPLEVEAHWIGGGLPVAAIDFRYPYILSRSSNVATLGTYNRAGTRVLRVFRTDSPIVAMDLDKRGPNPVALLLLNRRRNPLVHVTEARTTYPAIGMNSTQLSPPFYDLEVIRKGLGYNPYKVETIIRVLSATGFSEVYFDSKRQAPVAKKTDGCVIC